MGAMSAANCKFAFAFDVVAIDGLNTDASTVRYDISGQNVAVDNDTFPFPVFFADLENPNGCKNADTCAFDYNGECIKTFDDNVNKVHLAWPYDPNYTHKSVCEAYGIDVDLDGSRGVVEGSEPTGHSANNRKRFNMYVKRNANNGRRANLRRRAAGSPDEMGGGTNVVGPLKNDNRNLSDDLLLDAPLNDGADADNADYQPDDARERAMEARRRRRAMRKRAGSQSHIYEIVNTVKLDAPYDSDDDLQEAIDSAIDDALIYTQDVFEIAADYVSDRDIIPMFINEFYDDVMSQIDRSSLIKDEDEDYDIYACRKANGRKRGNMYVKRNAGKSRRAKKASMRRTASWAAESLAEDIVNDGPYADEGELYDAIMEAVDRSLIYSRDVRNIAQEYCSDGDIVELFGDDYADDVYNEVYKHDMSELIEGGEGEVEARRRRARKAKRPTRQSFRKRAQEADEDEGGDLPEFLEESGDDDEDEPEPEDEDEDDEPEEESEEDREARRAAVRKAMKAARGKVQKGARRVDEPEKNKPQMRQPVRVQRRSANVAGKPAATYDDTCLFM